MPRLPSKTTRWMLLLMGLGLLLRMWGLDFGLPNESRPDEIPILQSVTEHILTPLMTQGDFRLNPGFYAYPSLFLYLMTLASLLFYALGSLLGWFHGWQSYMMLYFTDATPLFLVQRWLSVLAGTAMIPVMYGLGKAIAPHSMKDSVGWLCAILTATCYLLIRNSHFGTVDSLFLLGVTLSLYQLLKFYATRQIPALDKACVCIGLTIGTKYPGALLILPLFITLAFQYYTEGFKGWTTQCLKALGMIGIVFCLTSPWLVLNPENSLQFFQAWGSFHYLPNTYAQPNTLAGWIFYPSLAIPFGYGPFLCLFSLFGLWWFLRHGRNQMFWILLSYALPAGLILGPNVHVMTRYAMILAPALLFFAACGIQVFCRVVEVMLGEAVSNRRLCQSVIVAGVLLFCLTTPVLDALNFDRLLAQPDTRTLARQWILQNVPPGSAVATGPSSGRIVLPRSYGQLLVSAAPNPEPPREVKTDVMDAQNLVINTYGDVDTLKKLGIHYVVMYLGLPVSSNAPWELEVMRKKAMLTAHWSPVEDPAPTNPVFDPIDAFFLPFHHFQGFHQPGPEIFIFRLP